MSEGNLPESGELLLRPTEAAGAVAVRDRATEGILQTSEPRLIDLVTQIAEQRDLYFDSLLEMGFGRRPLDQWFRRFKRSEVPRRYIGVDPDAAAVEALASRGEMAFAKVHSGFDMTSDLVIAADVLEYLTPSAAESFVKRCASLTSKMFALATLNAEHWNRKGIRNDFRWVRWVPDSVYECFPYDNRPGAIHNPVSAPQVLDLLRAAFDPSKWDLAVYEAHPWEIRELTTGNTARFSLKTFAFAIARN
ncbi:MAG: class I SAM-dependent methyltransferase [Enhydrobacter sp.]|nr:class I SAM-dependent methyltransferase [Enhydrobacter sp.]